MIGVVGIDPAVRQHLAAINQIVSQQGVPMVSDPTTARSSMRRALRRARDGVALDATEAGVLLHATGDDLLDLCSSAARVRDAGLATAGRPGVVTYSRKVFIPLTRLCRDRCHYCTFITVPGRLPAAYLSPDEILEIARQGAALRLQRSAVHPRRPPGGPLAAPGSGSTATVTTAPWRTCGRWPSGSWRRPACCRTSTQAS